jgi:membrane protein
MGGLPIYWVAIFFWRNLVRESINLRASSIAFNMFLSLFPSLIFLFTLLPYVPVRNLNTEILLFLKYLMPSAAFQTIDDTINDIMSTRSTSLLSFGLVAALYFASNGVYSLMGTFNRDDTRSYWKQKLVAIIITVVLGLLLIIGLSVFIVGQYVLDHIFMNAHIDKGFTYYGLILASWVMMFILLFCGITILYRHGDSRSERWRHIYPGAVLASVLTMITSIGYSTYVNTWGQYNKLYGSLGTMIVTMLWLYFNSMVLIAGHDFNRSLVHARLALMEKDMH